MADLALANVTGHSLPGLWSDEDEQPIGSSRAAMLMLGPTLMPGWVMPRFYAPIVARLADPELEVAYHPMPERGGLGRTDRIVDHFRPLVERAARRGEQLRLAGHSLGGIVAWALCHEYPETIQMAELWAAPLRGTFWAPTGAPVAESRFLARSSRFLAQYDKPIDGPFVRSIYTATDALAVPSMVVCPVEGTDVENHLVAPIPIPRPWRPHRSHQHVLAAGHTLLPRKEEIHRRIAEHDLRAGREWAVPRREVRAAG